VYYSFSELRKQLQIIFVNSSLIVFYISFIISSLAKHFNGHGTAGQRACGFFSAVLQYFMLVYLFWTTAEAASLMLMAKNNNSRHTRRLFMTSGFICYC